MKNKLILIGIVFLAVLICAFALWKSHPSSQDDAAAMHIAHYAIKNGKVYWEEYMQVGEGEWRLNEIEIPDADAATFKTVPLEKGTNLEADADTTTFVAITNEFGKDKAHIFWQGQELVAASSTSALDTATFKTLGIFVTDKKGVYELEDYYYWLIPGVDPQSFVFINRQYAKDAHAVYFLQDTGTKYEVLPIAGLNPSTFHVIGACAGAENYRTYAAADAHAVFAGDAPIKGADTATFRIVSEYDSNPDGFPMTGSYAVDKNHVYKDCDEIVQGVDPVQCTASNLKGCEAK